MMTLSLGKFAAAVGGVAVALSAATGVASADPIIDTTCNYGQVMAALNATDPATAAQLNSSPVMSQPCRTSSSRMCSANQGTFMVRPVQATSVSAGTASAATATSFKVAM